MDPVAGADLVPEHEVPARDEREEHHGQPEQQDHLLHPSVIGRSADDPTPERVRGEQRPLAEDQSSRRFASSMLTTASGRISRWPNFAHTPGSGRTSVRTMSCARCRACSSELKRPTQRRSPLLRCRKIATLASCCCCCGSGSGGWATAGAAGGGTGTA